MFAIMTVIVLFALVSSVFVLLPILLVIKAVQLLFEPPLDEVVGAVNEVRDHGWRNADAVEREQMERRSCDWRVIGRVVGAGALVGGAFVATSSTIGFACCLAA
jgi:hypothetical protein